MQFTRSINTGFLRDARDARDGRDARDARDARIASLLVSWALILRALGGLGALGGLVACSSSNPNELTGSRGGASDGDDSDPTNGAQSDGDVGDEGDGPLVGVDDTPGTTAPGTESPGLTSSATAETTADLNLRSGPATTYSVLAVIPAGTIVTVEDPTPNNGFLEVTWNGITGYCSAKYLTAASTTSAGPDSTDAADVNGPSSPANAIARAKLAVGFSYYWGGGAWLEAGVSSGNAGSCSGSCPSCTHSGKYGADCSGLIAKSWQFGPLALATNAHPYATSNFNKDSAGKWSTVSRGSLKAGDALVYNSGGAGHIVLFEKGDGWGASTVYECRGCSYGCVYNTRTFGTSYHGIRKAGF